MKKIITLILIVLICSCSKENIDIINLNNNKIDALGHGGMGTRSVYPLNAFESILKCLNSGADGTEINNLFAKFVSQPRLDTR